MVEALDQPVKLDLKDKKILFELDMDARMPYSKLGRLVGLSKQSVEYRVKNLIEKGVIKKFCTFTNTGKFRFYCRILFSFRNATDRDREKIVNYLTKHKKGFWITKGDGFYDVLVGVHVNSMAEFKNVIDELKCKFKDKINIISEGVTTDIIELQKRFLLGIEGGKEFHFREIYERKMKDELDEEILRVLYLDARTSLVDISKKVGQSSKVVAYRIKRMEQGGIIKFYGLQLDYNKIGYMWYKVFINLKKVSKNKLDEIKNYIKSRHIVIGMFEDIGLLKDINIEVVVKSDKEFFDFVKDLKLKFPGVVEDHQTIIVSGSLRQYHGPL